MTFSTNEDGNVAMIFGILVPVIMGALGISVDYSAWITQQNRLQSTADATVLAAANEMYLANADKEQIASTAKAIVKAHNPKGHGGIETSVEVLHEHNAVRVELRQKGNMYFSSMFLPMPPTIRVSALAKVNGGGRVCVIALEDSDEETITHRSRSSVLANECGIYSNSTSPYGITTDSSGTFEAELTCSAGGVYGSTSRFTPPPLTDCPQIEDPLADRQPPSYGGCKKTLLKLPKAIKQLVLFPGVYCGGLNLEGNILITLMPGIYVIKDGEFRVGNKAIIIGLNVGFYLTGDDARLKIEPDSKVTFTAPKTGPMAGLLFFEDRDAPPGRIHDITSDDARMLLGTIYLSRGDVVIASENPVADESAYTAIVARKIHIEHRTELHINADYDATDIPVPDGLGPVGGNVILAK